MKNIVKIIIIGAGNIGTRHLQGVLKSSNPLSITIVDPSLDSLELTKLRHNEACPSVQNSSLEYMQELPKNGNFDVAIISTKADIRAEITKKLLKCNKVKYIIFEKVLFQKEGHYKKIYKILEKENVKAWVNCPRRTWDVYKEIKKQIDKTKAIEINVHGSCWGMACNSVHFFDLFSYFVESSDIKITKTIFSNNIIKSKRDGNFYEVNGEIEAKIEKHSLKIISDEKNEKFLLKVNIKNNQVEYLIDESKVTFYPSVNDLTKQEEIKIPMQSNETGKIVDSLMSSNNCELTPYHESWKHHDPLIHSIKEHISKTLKSNLDKCPIT